MRLHDLVRNYFEWSGSKLEDDICRLSVDPLNFPQLHEMVQVCVGLIDQPLSEEELDAFLMSMALDHEDERILDYLKANAGQTFIVQLLSRGVRHPQSNARWQMTELLRKPIPGRLEYLSILLADSHPYVRKRAENVAEDIKNQR